MTALTIRSEGVSPAHMQYIAIPFKSDTSALPVNGKTAEFTDVGVGLSTAAAKGIVYGVANPYNGGDLIVWGLVAGYDLSGADVGDVITADVTSGVVGDDAVAGNYVAIGEVVAAQGTKLLLVNCLNN